jgi:hypothetical protein
MARNEELPFDGSIYQLKAYKGPFVNIAAVNIKYTRGESGDFAFVVDKEAFVYWNVEFKTWKYIGLSKSDIVNILTSDDVTKALSAKQGKDLKALIDALSLAKVDKDGNKTLIAPDKLALIDTNKTSIDNEVTARENADADLNSRIDSTSSGFIDGISPLASAPTPGKSGYYEFSADGTYPSWLEPTAGVTSVHAGDRVYVNYTTPSTYTYKWGEVNLGAAMATKVELTQKLNTQVVTNYLYSKASGKNTFNKDSAFLKEHQAWGDGTWVSLSDFFVSGLMSCEEFETYCINNSNSGIDAINSIYLFDFNGILSVAEKITHAGYTTFKTNAGTKYYAICMMYDGFNNTKNTMQIEKSSTPTVFESFDGSNLFSSFLTGEVAIPNSTSFDMLKNFYNTPESANIFNQFSPNYRDGGYYDGDGIWQNNQLFVMPALTKIGKNKTYSVVGGVGSITGIYLIDKFGNVKSGEVVAKSGYSTFSTKNDTEYYSLCVTYDNYKQIKSLLRIREGDSAFDYSLYNGGLLPLYFGYEYSIPQENLLDISRNYYDLAVLTNIFNQFSVNYRDGGYYNAEGIWFNNSAFIVPSLMKVQPSTTYSLNKKITEGVGLINSIYLFDKFGNVSTKVLTYEDNYSTITTDNGTEFISLQITKSNFDSIKSNLNIQQGNSYFEWTEYVGKMKPINFETSKSGIQSYFPVVSYPDYLSKIPNFRDKMQNRLEDVIVVMTGTSLTAGTLYATIRDDASERPPLLHTSDLSSNIFDHLIRMWDGQKYRRYDHQFFTLIGSGWEVTNTKPEWYDLVPYRNGLTKLSTVNNCGVSFVVPADAWQFNFIYRTDFLGGNCTVEISEGNGKMQVKNQSGTWVEANGYVFTMLESPVTASKGNTIYQNRLKMRCKNKSIGGINSIGIEKNLTIKKGNNSTDRFMFVGVEWSPAEFMFTLINGAGGSQAWNDNSLPVHQDSDIWTYNPDLIIAEVTMINWAAGCLLTKAPSYFVDICKKWYFNEFGNEPLSLYAKSNGYTDCEIVLFGDTMQNGSTDEASSWDRNGLLRWGVVTDAGIWYGTNRTAQLSYNAVENYIMKEKSNYIYIPINSAFKEVGEKALGSFYNAFKYSYNTKGDTLSYDGTHWNDNGTELAASLLNPIFRF